MTDADILQNITRLVNEEHGLERLAEQESGLTEEQHARMRQIQVSLDQCWDLLRRRRARRAAGQDPDTVEVRDANTVEQYKQ